MTEETHVVSHFYYVIGIIAIFLMVASGFLTVVRLVRNTVTDPPKVQCVTHKTPQGEWSKVVCNG